MRKMNRSRKHIIAFLSIIVALGMLVNDGYAFFIFGTDYFKNANLGVNDIYVSNTSFDDDDDSYYKVYFFASPYYATGSGSTPSLEEDPLQIANSETNPYNNSTDTYCTIGASKGENFSNAFYKDKNTGNVTGNHYVTYKKNNVEYLTGNYGDLEFFNVRDFTGYIRANEELAIEQTYTYVCADFKGNISSDYLSGIIAATEFKDAWGFGPEFIGWTYDKEASFYRTVYEGTATDTGTSTSTSYVRYSKGLGLYKCDTRGYGYGGGTVAEEIGNFGVQGTIDQVTSETSLEYLDSLSVDGSEKGDHIIYLYPVFSEKNYSSDKKFYDSTAFGDSVAAPMVKFRVNPGTNYTSKQSDEIDYTQNRYTTCLFIESLNESRTNPNYHTGNFYLDNDSVIQLDFDDWSGTWVTILDNTALDALKLENGYYNIDLTFWHSGSSSLDSTVTAYEESNNYVEVLSGTVVSGHKWTCYYVIGIQKVEDFYLNVHSSDGGSIVKTADLRITPEIDGTLYYVVDNVFLNEGQILSFSNSNISTLGVISDDDLSKYNGKNGTAYSKPGTVGTDTNVIKLSDNKITVNKSGHYSFIALINYDEGVASSATVAYKENDIKYHLIIYKFNSIYSVNGEIIDETVFSDTSNKNIYASYVGTGNSYLTNKTVITYNDTNKSSITIESIYNQGYVFVDTATGCEIPYSVFESGAFCLNRSYVLYYKEKTSNS